MNKAAFTLVELIFSIMIIAVVFTVVPQFMFTTTKTMEVSIKEDGLFAALALMGDVIHLPWDGNSISSGGKILDTSVNTCDDYRPGGFVGSRNCLSSSAAATPNGSFGTAGNFADVDDYDGYSTTTLGGRVSYSLDVDVNYVDQSLSATGGTTHELKEVKVSVSGSERTNSCMSLLYYSANLGQVPINKRAW